MDTSEFAYDLPPALIAQHPVEPRDAARLLVAGQRDGAALHATVADLPRWLRRGDLLVLNRTRVFPARLFGRKPSGGAIEVLLIHREAETAETAEQAEETGPDTWRALIRGRVRPGMVLDVAGLPVAVVRHHDDGERTIRFPAGTDVFALCERHGHIPLPPYIRRGDEPADRERYQSVFAAVPGSVAAPTASLHLTQRLLDRLAAAGIERTEVELAIGPGTFKPVDTERIEDFRIHAEHAHCPPAAVAAIAACRARGGRVVAIGTTVVRTLESAARQAGGLAPWSGWTRLFLHPPQRFQVVDALLTNFHLPRSSLLMLVACLTGVDRLRQLYREAVASGYRFFSYGDAMLLLPDPPAAGADTGRS